MKVYEASLKYSLVRECATKPVDSPERVYEYMQDAIEKNPMQESVWVVCLSQKNHPIGRAMVSLGSLSSAIMNPPEIFRIAILASAASIIVVHNHPSGDPSPSAADIRATKRVKECGTLMSIRLVDHLISGDPISDPNGKGYYSFQESGLC